MIETLMTIGKVFGCVAVIGVALAFYISYRCKSVEDEEDEYEANAHYYDTTKDV